MCPRKSEADCGQVEKISINWPIKPLCVRRFINPSGLLFFNPNSRSLNLGANVFVSSFFLFFLMFLSVHNVCQN